MSATPLDALERSRLCDLFTEVGPDAPTLCEGWETLDLAAHLVVRERDLRAAPGILFGGVLGGVGERLAAYSETVMEQAKAKGFDALVKQIRTGPPLPWRIPVGREWFNLNEFFVHHEDVRRANGRGSRTDIGDVEEALWRMLKAGAWLQLRTVRGAGVELARPDDDSVVTGKRGEPVVRITGSPGEVTLYLNGRKDAAEVELTGPPEAVTALKAARLGI
jgi:uncharacterized protein (TIGR03085 family)